MVVSPRDQRRPSRRAQRGRVVHVVAKPAVSEPLEVGGLNRPSESAGRPEANVICQDQQNIGRPGWSFNHLWKVWRRILYGPSNMPFKGRFGRRQDARGL